MNLSFICRVCRIAAIGAILLGSASCINIDEKLGGNLIPTEQKWDVFPQEPVVLENVMLQLSDSLSGYSSQRFVFGAINDGSVLGTVSKVSSITLVPVADTMDFGKNPKVRQFHFSAVRDTLSTLYDYEQKILQNVYVSELKKPLDSTIIYTNSLSDPEILQEFVDLSKRITVGIPVYSGGDSLSFDFSIEYAEKFLAGVDAAQKTGHLDSVEHYLNHVPGIYFSSDTPTGKGGRINMFNVGLDNSDGYLQANFAVLKITSEYDYSEEPVDTSFAFIFGPADFVRYDEDDNIVYPNQYAFNGSNHDTRDIYSKGVTVTDRIYVEGGGGVKPVVKAEEIKQIVEDLIAAEGITDPSEVVINKATIVFPYDVEGDYSLLDKYPDVLSPTVKLHTTDGTYVTYAGISDSSISTENQGEINRSLNMYSPDISHHVQAILNLDRNDEDYAKTIEEYNIWFLIMAQETIEDTTYDESSYSNYGYNSYYNMMYDPYGYGYGGYGGYGYGGYGYGYDSYGYGYNNYYNYAMMAAMYSSASGNSTKTTTELDKDRFYSASLNGPAASGAKPQLKVTFSAPKSAE